MTLRSNPGNDLAYRHRNMSKLFCYQRLKQLFLSPTNFKQCVLGLSVHERGSKKVDTEQRHSFRGELERMVTCEDV